MKRYECIKSGRFEMWTFNQGQVYEFDRETTSHNDVVFRGFTTPVGRIIWLRPDQMAEHFHELYEEPFELDHEAEHYSVMYPSTGLRRGCAWAVAILLIIGSIILSIIL